MLGGSFVGALIAGITSGTALAFSALLYAPLAYIALRLGRGCLRAGVGITKGHVVIHGPWRDSSFALEAVEGFTTGIHPVDAGGVFLKLSNGQAIPIWALASEGLIGNAERNAAKWETTAGGLNEVLARSRRGPTRHP